MGHVTVTMELRHGCVDVLLRLGCGGVGWGGVGHFTVTMELHHGCVDVLLRLAWGVVGWGMLPLPWNFIMAVLMSCYAWGGVGWGGVGHFTVTMELRHGCVDVLPRLAWGVVGWGMLPLPWNCFLYVDGAKAWKTAADSLKVKCFQVSQQMRQYCKDINDPSIGLHDSASTRTGKASKCGHPIKPSASRKWLAFPKSTQALFCGATNSAGAAAQVTRSRTSFSKNWQSFLSMRTSE